MRDKNQSLSGWSESVTFPFTVLAWIVREETSLFWVKCLEKEEVFPFSVRRIFPVTVDAETAVPDRSCGRYSFTDPLTDLACRDSLHVPSNRTVPLTPFKTAREQLADACSFPFVAEASRLSACTSVRTSFPLAACKWQSDTVRELQTSFPFVEKISSFSSERWFSSAPPFTERSVICWTVDGTWKMNFSVFWPV